MVACSFSLGSWMRVGVANYSALDIARYRLPELTATSSSMVGIARWPPDHTAFLTTS
jgi:hypothetical protein